MEATILAVTLIIGAAVGLDRPAAPQAEPCTFVKAENSNFLFASNPECYAPDPVGAYSPDN